ncbi:MAG TPA: hypothetical protein VHF86_10965, partial [Xanthomonadaceae bacterium]|nr:hypothetical protein [Xanthomonadaceae bacterium]
MSKLSKYGLPQGSSPKYLLLSLSIVLALAACNRGAEPGADASADAAKPADTAGAGYTIDESKLPPVNRFDVA